MLSRRARIFIKNQNFDFSKIRLSGIHKNDIVITYGTGYAMILSVFRVVSEQPHYATDEEKLAYDWKERWPWSLEAENLTCAFSRNWFCHSLILENLKAEFIDAYSHSCITWSGECSFGRFNHGGDKLG